MPHRRRDYEDDVDPDEDLEEDDDEEYDSRHISSRKRRRSDFIDDAALEDDEEDEDDEDEDDYHGRERGGVRKKKSAATAYFDIEALVDEDEEEEEEEGEDDFIDHATDLQDRDESRRMHHRTMLPREEEQEDVDALETRIKARYSRSSHSEYDEETTDVEQQALLPSVKDPKLWMVKCAVGHEREAVICLMQKYIDKGSELQIRSAVALDHLKNFIYVEADKESHVREACKGLRNIYLSKIMLVPIKEMTDVLSVDSKTVDICRDSWVRLKIGTYKGDLAKVVDVDNVRQRVTVKLIPRIDLEALATKMEGREVVKKKAFVPPPRFMNVEEARKMNIRVEHRRDPITGDYFENIFGMLFKDGFLYKAVSMKTISTQSIQPTFDELEKFRHSDGGDNNASGLSTLFANRKKGHFMKGDQVIVIKGDLKNLKGCVEKVDEENVHIRPKMEGLPDTLAVNEKELCKYFEPGNHVKVVSGTHEGATGMVITIEEHVVIILSDTTKEHIRVFSDHVAESSEVTTGLTRIGAYELHDLILLDDMNFGLIIRVESEAFQILKGIPNRAEVGLVKMREIKHKIEKRSYAPDRSRNTISIKDIVKILDGPCKGKQGPVEHIFRGVLFIYDRHHLEHAGFICTKSHSCILVGGSRSNGNKNGGIFTSRSADLRTPTRTMETSRPPRAPVFNGGGFGGRCSDPIVGKMIKIRSGPHKGYRGRVVDIKGNMVRVELESRMKVVTVERDLVSDNLVISARIPMPNAASGSETPMHNARTPMRPFMTPMRETGGMTLIHDGMRTPMRDGMRTPMHDGLRTPVHDDGIRTPVHDQQAWNPSPSRNNWEERNSESWASPQYHPGSPPSRMYEAPTPGSGWAGGHSYGEAGTPRDSGASYANVHSPYIPSTPGEQPLTPSSMSYIPGTPGAQPMTPGTGAMDAMSPVMGGDGEGPVLCPDFVVTVRRGMAGGESVVGVVHEVLSDGSCVVAVQNEWKKDLVVAGAGEIELVAPKKFDRIFIMGGGQRGQTGRLIGVDNTDGIVKLDSTLDVTILDMAHLAKLDTR